MGTSTAARPGGERWRRQVGRRARLHPAVGRGESGGPARTQPCAARRRAPFGGPPRGRTLAPRWASRQRQLGGGLKTHTCTVLYVSHRLSPLH